MCCELHKKLTRVARAAFLLVLAALAAGRLLSASIAVALLARHAVENKQKYISACECGDRGSTWRLKNK